jgi:hypothetical protein
MFTLSVMEHKQLYGNKPGAAEGEIGRSQDFHFDNQNVGALSGRAYGPVVAPYF